MLWLVVYCIGLISMVIPIPIRQYEITLCALHRTNLQATSEQAKFFTLTCESRHDSYVDLFQLTFRTQQTVQDYHRQDNYGFR